jgi:hypothetical protein
MAIISNIGLKYKFLSSKGKLDIIKKTDTSQNVPLKNTAEEYVPCSMH